MQSEKKRHRSSILKPPKARNPLGDLDLEPNSPDMSTFDKNKRVSFSSKKGVALFTMTDQGTTIWHNFYEVPNKTDSLEASELFACSSSQKLEASVDDKKLNNEIENNIYPRNSNYKNNSESDDQCLNISAMINSLKENNKKQTPDLCESLNPSMYDHTEALINYKISESNNFFKVDDIENYGKNDLNITKLANQIDNQTSENESDMSITQALQTPIQIVTSEKKNSKLHSTNTFVYSNVKVKKDKAIQDKENVQILTCMNDSINNIEDIHNIPLIKNDIKVNKISEIRDYDSSLTFTNFQTIDGFENEQKIKENREFDITSDNVDENYEMYKSKKYDITILNDISRMIHYIEDKHAKVSSDFKNDDTINDVTMKSTNDEVDLKMTEFLESKIINSTNKIVDPYKMLHLSSFASTCNDNNRIQQKKSLKFSSCDKNFQGANENTKTILFDESCSENNMSITCITDQNLNNNKSTNTDTKSLFSNMNKSSDKQKTIIFDQNEDMSITCIPEQLKSHSNIDNIVSQLPTSLSKNQQHKTIIFNEKESDGDMSMTCIASDLQYIELDDKRLTDLCCKNDTKKIYDHTNSNENMSITCVDDIKFKNDNVKTSIIPLIKRDEKCKTIIFDEGVSCGDMSMTCITTDKQNLKMYKNIHETDKINSINHNYENKKQKMEMSDTINFSSKIDINKTTNFDKNNSEGNMSMTCMNFDLEVSKYDNQKTMVFDQENFGIAMSRREVNHSARKPSISKTSCPVLNNANNKSKTMICDKRDFDNYMPTTCVTSVIQSKFGDKNDSNVLINNKMIYNNRETSKHALSNCVQDMFDIDNILKSVVSMDKNNGKNDIESLATNLNKAEISSKSLDVIPNSQPTRDNIIMNNNHTQNMDITNFTSDNQSGMMSIKKLTNPLTSKQNKFCVKQNTLITNEKITEGNVSLTCILQNSGIVVNKEEKKLCNDILTKNIKYEPIMNSLKNPVIEPLCSNLNSNNERRKTIIFNQNATDGDMSMTCMIPDLEELVKNKIHLPEPNCYNKNEKRKTIIFDQYNTDGNMSMTCVMPNSQALNQKEQNFNESLCSNQNTNNVKRKTIIFDHCNTDGNMSMTCVIPNSQTSYCKEENFTESLCSNQNTKNEKRKTLIFDQYNTDGNMSMTCVMPNSQASIQKEEYFTESHCSNQHTNNEKRKTIIFDQQNIDGNMSMTCVIPNSQVSNKKEQNFTESLCSNQNTNNEKRKTIIFDHHNTDGNMSMTCMIPNSQALNKKEQNFDGSLCSNQKTNNDKRKTIIFDQHNTDGNMSMTCVMPNSQASIQKEQNFNESICSNQNTNNNDKRKTIIFDQHNTDGNMSMTCVIPNSQSSNYKEENFTESLCSNQNTNNNKRKTLIFDQHNTDGNMSMTCVMPNSQASIQKEEYFTESICSNQNTNNDKRKTLIFDQHNIDGNMSMTCVIPNSQVSNKKEQYFTESICSNQKTNNDKRKTIIFDQHNTDGNMSMTCVIPNSQSSNYKEEYFTESICSNQNTNNDKRKTIIFDHYNTDGNMSMTCVIPNSQTSYCKEENFTESLCSNQNTNNDKRKTLIFDQQSIDGNMSMTRVIPNSQTFNQKEEHFSESLCSNQYTNNDKRKNLIFENNAKQEISITSLISDIKFSKSDENITNNIIPIVESGSKNNNVIDQNNCNENISTVINSNKCEKTIIIDNPNSTYDSKNDILTTCAKVLINSNKIVKKIPQNEVIFKSAIDNNLFSKTQKHEVICDNSTLELIVESNKKKTIAFDQKDIKSDSSMKCMLSNLKQVNVKEKSTEIETTENILLNTNNSEENVSATLNVLDNIQENLCENRNNKTSAEILSENEDVNYVKMSENASKVNDIPKTDNSVVLDSFTGINISKTSEIINPLISKKFSIQLEEKTKENCDVSMLSTSHKPSILHISIEEKKISENSSLQVFSSSADNYQIEEMHIFNQQENKVEEASTNFVKQSNCSNIKASEIYESNGNIHQSTCFPTQRNNLQLEFLTQEKSPIKIEQEHNINNQDPIEEKINSINDLYNVNNLQKKNSVDEVMNMSIDESMSEFYNNDNNHILVEPNIVCQQLATVSKNQDNFYADMSINENECNIKKDFKRKYMKCDQQMIKLENYLASPLAKKVKQDLKYVDLSNNKSHHENGSQILRSKYEDDNIDVVMIDNKIVSDTIERKDVDIHVNTNGKRKSQESSSNLENEELNDIKRTCINNQTVVPYVNNEDVMDKISIENKKQHENNENKKKNDVSLEELHNKMLDNISEISLVDTTLENSRKSDNVITTENCSVESVYSIEDLSVNKIYENIKSLDFNKLDCVVDKYGNTEWTFLLFQQRIKLHIHFEKKSDINNELNLKTQICDITLESLCDEASDVEMFLSYMAFMKQLQINELKSQCIYCEHVPQILEYCSDISFRVRKWSKTLKLLYFQYGLIYDKHMKKFIFRIPSGALRCIWEISIDDNNMPFAELEDIHINIVTGNSSISRSDFMTVIENIDCNWDYMKNLIDNLFSFIREIAD